MGEAELEVFCRLMRGAETFCGIRVLTFAVLSNHFHILAEIPEQQKLSETDIVARLPTIYDAKTVLGIQAKWALWRKQELEQLVQQDLTRLRARMHGVSSFMKTVKQRFTQWYNRREGRCGTLWESRFTSVLVQPPTPAQAQGMPQGVDALATLAAYIDLNAVRAGLVQDPKDYRWCGYGEAMAGKKRARAGLATVLGEERQTEWCRVAARYRLLVGAVGKEGGLTADGTPVLGGISAEQVEQVIRERGEFSLRQVLRCRVRYFSDGVAIGDKAFIDKIFRSNRGNFGPKRKDGARPLRFADWNGLCSMRDLRLAPIVASGG